MIAKLNTSLKGFRGLLAIWLPYAVGYIDMVTANLTGLTPAQLKAAAVLAALPTIKLIVTDASPRMLNWIADRFAK
jgi:hypothetical protein